MTEATARWLMDTCLPRGDYGALDAVHVTEFSRVPGPAGLREATDLDRTLVTCSEGFLGPCELAIEHPGVVIFEDTPTDAMEVSRNLEHLMFRLGQFEGMLSLAGNRFLVRADRGLYVLGAEGHAFPLEPWQTVRMKRQAAAIAV